MTVDGRDDGHSVTVLRVTAAADVDRDQLTLERSVAVDGSLTWVNLDGQRVAVDDAKTAASSGGGRSRARAMDDTVAGRQTVQFDGVRIVVGDPRFADGQHVQPRGM